MILLKVSRPLATTTSSLRPGMRSMPVQGVVHRVEDIGFAEAGNAQRIQGAEDGLLVLGKVDQDMRLHIELDHRDPVLRLQIGRENIRRSSARHT